MMFLTFLISLLTFSILPLLVLATSPIPPSVDPDSRTEGLSAIDLLPFASISQYLAKREALNSSLVNPPGNATKPWPDATITYRFDSVGTATDLGPIINASVATWQLVAPWLQFNELPPGNISERGVLFVTSACTLCGATVGYSDYPLLNLIVYKGEAICDYTCLSSDRVVHELGHVIGFMHEHQRSNRDEYVAFECENLNPYCASGLPLPANETCCTYTGKDCCGDLAQYQKLTTTPNEKLGDYDVHSIMHYSSIRFTNPNTTTLVGVNGTVVPDWNPAVPSEGDKEKVCKFYEVECLAWRQECQNAGGLC